MWFSDEKVRKGGKWCVLGCLSSALSDENNQRWRHNRRDPWWCSLRPRYNDPSEQGHTSNEWDRPLPNTQHPHKNKVLTKRGGDGSYCERKMQKIPEIKCIMFILHDALIKFDPINYTKQPGDDFRMQTWFYLHWMPPMAIPNHHLHTSPGPAITHHDRREFGGKSEIVTGLRTKTDSRYAKLILPGPPVFSWLLLDTAACKIAFCPAQKLRQFIRWLFWTSLIWTLAAVIKAGCILNIQEKLGLFVKLAKFKIRVFWFTYCQVVKVGNAESWSQPGRGEEWGPGREQTNRRPDPSLTRQLRVSQWKRHEDGMCIRR